ncbi:hypothetical protein POPTR_001G259208v4 [Populus trichocarpa]|uniref:Uncharacterized protein n=1 Tax=Populus trichocarpa TaxID=3694 RepID=A0ACC0TLX5_POPTR|nr:hypothetical protein POPTR_001G259208v4 [Populus trichocarpa]
MTRQQESPIVFLGDSRAPRPSPWRKFLQLKEQDRLQHLKRMVKFQQPPNQEEEQMTWSWRNLLNSIFGQENKKKCENGKSPDSFNIYDRRPNFRNNYGWITAIDESDYQPLRHSGIGVCLVNLTAGSMMAPRTFEPISNRVWNCFEWKQQNTDCVSKWNTSDECKSKSRRCFLGPKILPLLSNCSKVRFSRVLRIHNFSSPEQATALDWCKLNSSNHENP